MYRTIRETGRHAVAVHLPSGLRLRQLSKTLSFAVLGLAGAVFFLDAAPSLAAPPPGGALYVETAGDKVPDQYVVVLRDGVAVPEAAAEMAAAHGGDVLHVYRHALSGFAARIPEGRLQALLRDPRVLRVEEDAHFEIDAAGDQPDPPSWGLDRIDERTLPVDGNYHWDFSGEGVDVYLIDTGVDTTHPDFAGRASWGLDCTGEGQFDSHGNGTHVAGIVGGETYGVAKDADLIAVKICHTSCFLSELFCGFDFVIAEKIASPATPAVANVTLYVPFTQSLNDAVANGVAAGVFFAVMAGNEATDACQHSPAAEPAAFTVGASTLSDARSSFSNLGVCVDIFAPGSSITSTWNNGGTNTVSGTTMASAHAAGAAALVLEQHPAWTPDQVASALKARATQGVLSSVGPGSPNLLLYTLDDTDCSFPLYVADFEDGGADGWTTGNDTCTDGFFVVGDPEKVMAGGVQTQPDGSAEGTGSFFTQPNNGPVNGDVDDGTCEALSPSVGASGSVKISLDYFHGQRDAGNDGVDGFAIEVLRNGVVADTMVALGDDTSDAQWTRVTSTVEAGSGSQIQLRVQASDGAAVADIVEGGVDNVEICGLPEPPPPPPPSSARTAPGRATSSSAVSTTSRSVRSELGKPRVCAELGGISFSFAAHLEQ